MKRIIEQITQKLIRNLPDNKEYYKLVELRTWHFPLFVIQHVRIELERNLKGPLRPPKTDWADMHSEIVHNAWQEFEDVVRSEARLPANFASTIIETSVADVLEMLVQPRKNIPGIIFGTDDKLTLQQIIERMKLVVVYRHFSSLIPRYMQKRGLDILSKDRCAQVIENADEKMTARYSPMNWAQMLEPLFNLTGEQIDTTLIRLFFEDKKRPRLARQFDLTDATVDRARFIEILSLPDLSEVEDNSSDLLESDSSTATTERSPDEFEKPNKQPHGTSPDFMKEKSREESKEKGRKKPSGVNRADAKSDKKGVSEPDDPRKDNSKEDIAINGQEEKPDSLNTIFSSDENEEREEAELISETEGGTKEVPLNDIFAETETDEHEDEENEKTEKNNKADELRTGVNPKEPVEANAKEKEEQDEPMDKLPDESVAANENNESERIETPMWQRFMSKDNIEDANISEEENTLGEGEFMDEPAMDLRSTRATPKSDLKQLQRRLEDRRNYFVEEIFRGSEWAYEEAMAEISGKNNWEEASNYIEKDVFQRNLVDMYSEAAVDFTDRLQAYFLEK